MKKLTVGLGILLFILVITALYVGIISFLVYLLSLISKLNITINSWLSLFKFSLCIILWIVPYALLNIFQAIGTKSKNFKLSIRLISETVSVILFTLYINFLDKHFVNLTFSKIGLISVTTVTLVFTVILNAAGEKLKENNTKTL